MSLILQFSSNPKSYYAICRESNNFKRSSKGVQHRIELSYEHFKDVVYKSECKEVKNVSIRVFDGTMSTVETKKIGLRNVFSKGYVGEDRVTITPFNRFMHKD